MWIVQEIKMHQDLFDSAQQITLIGHTSTYQFPELNFGSVLYYFDQIQFSVIRKHIWEKPAG